MSERVSSGRRSSARSSAGRQNLAARRRGRRRRLLIACGVLLLIAAGAVLYGIHQSAVRISHVEVFGADASLAATAQRAMEGSYLGIIPRDSIFFFPEDRIRANVVAADSDISTVSVFRSGLTGLTIKVNNRVPIARWCGSTYSPRVGTSTTESHCYVFDDRGFVFATTTDVPLVNAFDFYEVATTSSGSMIGSTIPHVEEFPAAFNFARQIATLGSSVQAVVIRENEIDNHLTSGTRITYLLGNEENAFTALVSAKSKMDLSDGSLDYVDLRFDGKIYLKKRGGGVQEQ